MIHGEKKIMEEKKIFPLYTFQASKAGRLVRAPGTWTRLTSHQPGRLAFCVNEEEQGLRYIGDEYSQGGTWTHPSAYCPGPCGRDYPYHQPPSRSPAYHRLSDPVNYKPRPVQCHCNQQLLHSCLTTKFLLPFII